MHVPLIAFEAGLGVVVIGWGFWELASLRRDRRRMQALAAEAAAAQGTTKPAQGERPG